MNEVAPSQSADWIRAAVERYEGRLLRYAVQITGDLERSRDVVQDTFLKLCRAERSQVDDHLAEWLFTVCRNQALDVRRKEKRMTIISDSQAANQESREIQQEAASERQDTAAHIQRLLEGLSDNQQEVVRLKFQSGLSYREISRVTELSVSNVGYLIHTALQKIRKQINVDCH